MVGENYVAKLGIVAPRASFEGPVPGGLFFKSRDEKYAYVPLRVEDDVVLERLDRMRKGKPTKADENLKDVLVAITLKSKAISKPAISAYVEPDKTTLTLWDGKTSKTMASRVGPGLLAALLEGAEIHAAGFFNSNEFTDYLQAQIMKFEDYGGFEELSSYLPVVQKEPIKVVDKAQYKEMFFADPIATCGEPEGPKGIAVAIPYEVMIDVEIKGKRVLIGHAGGDLSEMKRRGTDDEVLRVAFVLGDEETKIMAKSVEVKVPPSYWQYKKTSPGRATNIYTVESESEKPYRVELQMRPLNSEPDIMERAVTGRDRGTEEHLAKMDRVPDTASLMAKLLLEEGARIKTIYLGLAELVTEPEPAINQKRKSEFDRSPGERAFVIGQKKPA